MSRVLAQAAQLTDIRKGPDRHRSRHRLRRCRHRPRHRHRPRGGQRHLGDVPPAGVGRNGAHHHVPRHRIHRSARTVRLRPRLHHLGLRGTRAHRKLLAAPARSLRRRAFGRRRVGGARQPTEPDSARGRPGVHRAPRRGRTIDDCQKAPSPILPAKNELIWGTHLVRRPLRAAVEVRLARP